MTVSNLEGDQDADLRGPLTLATGGISRPPEWNRPDKETEGHNGEII